MNKLILRVIGILGFIIFFSGCVDDGDALTESFEGAKLSKISDLEPVAVINNWSYNKPAMIMSTDPQYQGNMEIIRRNGSQLEHLWWNENYSDWNSTTLFGSNIRSDPALCSNLDDNLLQVVAREYGKLVHYWRNSSYQWVRQAVINNGPMNDDYYIYSPGMISNKVTHELEVVAISSYGINNIHHYTRTASGWGHPTQLFPSMNANFVNGPAIGQDNSPQKRVWVAGYVSHNSVTHIMIFSRIPGQAWVKKGMFALGDGESFDANVKPEIIAYNDGADSYVEILGKVQGHDNWLMSMVRIKNNGDIGVYYQPVMYGQIRNLSATTWNHPGGGDSVFVYYDYNPGILIHAHGGE